MKRIVAIDTLRGFALMGILLMNIMSFAMPDVAYYNPAGFGGDEWFNRLTYAVVHVMADQKFMGLFSMLFGASVMLIIRNLERKGEKTARFHYVRNIWLLVIGSLHAAFIWGGDILVIYAICSFALYFMRNMAPKNQFILGMIVFMLPAVGYIGGYYVVDGMSPAEIGQLDNYWMPSAEAITAEIDYYRGTYGMQVTDRLGFSASDTEFQESPAEDVWGIVMMIEFFTRALGMMLVGMAFYAWGIVTAKMSDPFYKRLLIGGFGLGLVIASVGVWINSQNGWAAHETMFVGRLANLFATPFVVSGYIALIMLWSQSQIWTGLQDRLSAAGRMALTNYIGQSVLGTFIFYGFGLGLFGMFNRLMLIPFVVLIWAIQLWISPIWLQHFKYGPLEWAWRSLSYWKLQPFRR